jgi:hypothetical protein
MEIRDLRQQKLRGSPISILAFGSWALHNVKITINFFYLKKIP